MLNFAGQDVAKGDYIGQVARTNQGMKKRIGVVTGIAQVEVRGEPVVHLRVIWDTYDEETGLWELSDNTVDPRYVFKIDRESITHTVAIELGYAAGRGHA